MTYKELVNSIKQIVQDHYMLVDFGYGQISDIKSGGDDGEADYPYAFLNPGSHTRGERSITYRFNLIVMDMYLGDDFLTAQSQCQQYIDDILAEMKYGTQDYDININATLTPFKERFQDVVGGMTATLEIEVGQKLNLCIAPIDVPVSCNPKLTVFSDSTNTFENVLDPDGSNRNWRWETNTQENTEVGMFDDVYFSNAVTGDFEFYVTQSIRFVEPVAGEVLPQRPVLNNLFGSYGPIEPICDSGNWPTEWPGVDPILYTAKYNVTINSLTSFGIVGFENPAEQESAVIQEVGGTLTIGYGGVIPEPIPQQLVLDASSTEVHTIRPELQDNPQPFPNVILDTYDGMRPSPANYYTITEDGNWTFVMTGTGVRITDIASFPTGFNLTTQNGGVDLEADVSNWPTDPAVGVNFEFELKWTDIPLEVSNGFVAFQTKNEPPLEDQAQTFIGTNLKGYYQA